MASYKTVPKQANPLPGNMHIRYKGTWDMQELYESVVDHLRSRKWKFHEKVYKHKHPSPFGMERQYVWEAEQRVDDWVEVKINIYIHTYDAHDIEVADSHGEKKVLTQGKIWVVLKINDIWDPDGQWDSNSFWGQMKDFFVKYVVRKRRMQGYSPRYRHELVILYYLILRKLKMETKDYTYQHHAGVNRRAI